MHRNEHLVNYVVIIPDQRPILYKTIQTTGTSQTGVESSNKLCEVIEELGKDKVSSVVTDNASCMRAAWTLIERRYPHVFANGCAAHVLNLLVKDIIGLEENKRTLQSAVDITNFIKGRGSLAKAFRELQSSKETAKRFLFAGGHALVHSVPLCCQRPRQPGGSGANRSFV
jgi:hypothetical protein